MTTPAYTPVYTMLGIAAHAHQGLMLPCPARWQPIETAPRDGTCFLAFEPGRENKDIWPDMIAVCRYQFGYLRVAHVGGYDIEDEIEKPTHWMELPKPPE